jgi:hypothetical protein
MNDGEGANLFHSGTMILPISSIRTGYEMSVTGASKSIILVAGQEFAQGCRILFREIDPYIKVGVALTNEE